MIFTFLWRHVELWTAEKGLKPRYFIRDSLICPPIFTRWQPSIGYPIFGPMPPLVLLMISMVGTVIAVVLQMAGGAASLVLVSLTEHQIHTKSSWKPVITKMPRCRGNWRTNAVRKGSFDSWVQAYTTARDIYSKFQPCTGQLIEEAAQKVIKFCYCYNHCGTGQTYNGCEVNGLDGRLNLATNLYSGYSARYSKLKLLIIHLYLAI